MIFANFVYLIPVHYLIFISSIKEEINQEDKHTIQQL